MMESSLGKRQTRTNCTSAELCVNPPKFEDLNFTDAQRQFCNDIKSCLYDLAVTGSEDFAAASRDFDSNKTVTTEILSELNSFISNTVQSFFVMSRQPSTKVYC